MRNLRKVSLPLSQSSSYLRRRPANDSQSPFLCPLVGLQAAKTLRITATKLCKLQIADGVIPVNDPFFYSMQLFLFYFLLSATFICPSVETMTNWHLLQTIKWDETWLFACKFDERTVVLFNCLKFVYVVCPGCFLVDPATFFYVFLLIDPFYGPFFLVKMSKVGQSTDLCYKYGWLFRIGFCKKILFLSNHS